VLAVVGASAGGTNIDSHKRERLLSLVVANASALIDVIGEPTRRAIVERLVEGPASVTDVARDLPITRSAVSQHLQILKAVGLVVDRAVGTRRIYAVDPEALAVIRAYFDAFWTRSLAAFRATAELSKEDP
jgi:DNA-binding transcriptional ArsR family regulator